jgi:hypothetical protein
MVASTLIQRALVISGSLAPAPDFATTSTVTLLLWLKTSRRRGCSLQQQRRTRAIEKAHELLGRCCPLGFHTSSQTPRSAVRPLEVGL